jgi:hypothetical protein
VIARLEGHGTHAACANCRGPRIVANLGGEAAKRALREQQRALTTARALSMATVVQALIAATITTVGLLVNPSSVKAWAIWFAIGMVPLLLALRSRSRAAKARAEAEAASERAWQAAAEAVAAKANDGVTAEGLATALGIEPAHAERLLTSLTVHERTRIDVGNDAEVRYSAAPSNEEEVAKGTKRLDGDRGPR